MRMKSRNRSTAGLAQVRTFDSSVDRAGALLFSCLHRLPSNRADWHGVRGRRQCNLHFWRIQRQVFSKLFTRSLGNFYGLRHFHPFTAVACHPPIIYPTECRPICECTLTHASSRVLPITLWGLQAQGAILRSRRWRIH